MVVNKKKEPKNNIVNKSDKQKKKVSVVILWESIEKEFNGIFNVESIACDWLSAFDYSKRITNQQNPLDNFIFEQ